MWLWSIHSCFYWCKNYKKNLRINGRIIARCIKELVECFATVSIIMNTVYCMRIKINASKSLFDFIIKDHLSSLKVFRASCLSTLVLFYGLFYCVLEIREEEARKHYQWGICQVGTILEPVSSDRARHFLHRLWHGSSQQNVSDRTLCFSLTLLLLRLGFKGTFWSR